MCASEEVSRTNLPRGNRKMNSFQNDMRGDDSEAFAGTRGFIHWSLFTLSTPGIRKTRNLRVEDLSRGLQAYTLLGVIVPPSA